MITGYYNSTIIQYFMQSSTQTHEGYVYSPHDSIATAYIPFDPAQALYKDGTLSTFTGLSVDIGIFASVFMGGTAIATELSSWCHDSFSMSDHDYIS